MPHHSHQFKHAIEVAEGDGTYNEVFRTIPLDSFPKPKSGAIVTLNSADSVAQALHVLTSAKILAAPVRGADGQSWLGVVDFNSIVQWMQQQTWGQAPATLEELRTLKASFKSTTLEALFAEGRHTPFVTIDAESETSLLDAMLYLGKHGIHRVFLTEGGVLTNVITQSAIFGVIASNLESFSGIISKPISALGLGSTGHVVSVTLQDSYWEAFRKMNESHVSAVAVVDANGSLVGNISSHDLRTKILDPAQFAELPKPIGDFFVKGKDLFTIKASDTLEHVVRQFQASWVHRLYVVDAEGKPTGVVSLRDVIAQFVREPATEDGSPYLAYFK